MTIQDAIHWIDIARMGYICDPNECGLEKGGDPCKAFHCDETHDALVMAMDTLEKQIPQKTNYATDHTWGTEKEVPVCPNCDYYITPVEFIDVTICETTGKCKTSKVTYCDTCGQAIDWSDKDDTR